MPEEIREQRVRMPDGSTQTIRVKVLATGSREARRAEQRRRQQAARQKQQAAPQPAAKDSRPASS